MTNNIVSQYFGSSMISFRKGTSDEDVLAHSFENDIFLKGIPEYTLKPYHTIIDVGAHIGSFSVLVSRSLKKGKVFAFEPCNDTFQILERNKLQNKLQNLQIFQVALSGVRGKTKLYHDIEQGNWGHTITVPISEEGEEVLTDTLENFFEELQISRCHLLKFNCEGAEFDIIMNSTKKTLDKVNFLLVLYHEDLCQKYKVEDLTKHLRVNGFKTKIRYQTSVPPRGWIIAYRKGFRFQAIAFIRYIYKMKIIVFVKRIGKRIAKMFN